MGGYCGAIADWTTTDVFTRHLDLCGVGSTAHVALLSDADAQEDALAAARLAVLRLGATPIVVSLRQPMGSHAESPVVTAAAQAADVVVDFRTKGFGQSSDSAIAVDDEHAAVLVMRTSDTERINRNSPHPGLSHRVQRATDRCRDGSELTLSCDNGTSLTIDLGESSISGQTGVATKGEVALWPSGQCIVIAGPKSVHGTVVLMPGDLHTTLGEYVRSPVTLTIQNNHVAEIQGGHGDTDLVRSMLEASGATDGYNLTTVLLGLNHLHGHRTDDPTGRSIGHPDDASIAAGIITLGFGGTDEAPIFATALRQRTLSVDGQELVSKGWLQGDLKPDVYEAANHQ